tara:strand:- start:4916 stop:5710 length:795 start_codon:yes stop_codon:yes gene_type:complete
MKKKVLLLLSGQVRTYDNEIVINGWRKFRDKYDTTTFLCCWNNRGRSLYSIKHYSNDMVIEEEAINLENIQEVFKTDNIKLLDYNEWFNGLDLKPWMKELVGDQFFNSVFAAFYLKKHVFNFALENISQDQNFDGVFLTRPDMFFLREPPDYPFSETEYIWQQNAPENFFANRIYDNFLFSSFTNIGKICSLYDSPLLSTSIDKNFGTNLHYLDPCKILYSYFLLAGITHKSYDHLYAEPYRREEDKKNHRDHYLGGHKMWCEK